MLRFFPLIIFFFFTACGVPFMSTEGLRALESGEYDRAKVLLEEDLSGDPGTRAAAAYGLGTLYMNGNGVEQDVIKAEGYYLVSALGEDPRAMEALSAFYKAQNQCSNDALLAEYWGYVAYFFSGDYYGNGSLAVTGKQYLPAVSAAYRMPCGERPSRLDVSDRLKALFRQVGRVPQA